MRLISVFKVVRFKLRFLVVVRRVSCGGYKKRKIRVLGDSRILTN